MLTKAAPKLHLSIGSESIDKGFKRESSCWTQSARDEHK
jgi:hypothetical protein